MNLLTRKSVNQNQDDTHTNSMKTNLTIFGLLILVSISAQDIKRFDFQFDFGATISIPTTKSYETMVEFEGHPETQYKSGLGYFAEILLTYNFNNKLGLQSGVNYSQNNLRVTDNIGLIESIGDIKTNYINLPILIKYRLSNSSPFTVSGGVYLGVIINANQNGTTVIDTARLVVLPGDDIPLVEPETNYSDNIKSNFKDFDFGLSFQIDYEFTFSDNYSGLVFSRFNFGILDVRSDEFYGGSRYSIDKWRNMGLIIGLGIRI
jgi:hypothetical protein